MDTCTRKPIKLKNLREERLYQKLNCKEASKGVSAENVLSCKPHSRRKHSGKSKYNYQIHANNDLLEKAQAIARILTPVSQQRKGSASLIYQRRQRNCSRSSMKDPKTTSTKVASGVVPMAKGDFLQQERRLSGAYVRKLISKMNDSYCE